MRMRPGEPYPLGATWDGMGVNFALYSEHAARVELCLFDSADESAAAQVLALPERNDMVWHGYLQGVRPGQLYGYRVHGPYQPGRGDRFNPNKLLLDPYTRAVARAGRWHNEMYGYRIGSSEQDLSFDPRDSGPFAPLSVVTETAFSWGDDRPPRRPWHQTVIYELHVKGFTRLHPLIPEKLRGTYAGLATGEAIQHLLRLGITAVELMPVHHPAYDRHLVEQGLTNYWGYNTIGYFAPNAAYAAAREPLAAISEFKTMVRTLHSAGIEVILDVVYNHTGEGNHLGPTVCFRGIDNRAYYRLWRDPRYYLDFTGCGNTLNMMNPRVLQLIMDSLRYWVVEMHVDGFRFDLASTLARELYEVDRLGAFFDIIHQDPVLSRVKLIAEPWDLGEGGYQVGNFPVLWSEWNGKYRDTMRRFWRGEPGIVSELASRLCGSSDLYGASGRRPHASINFAASHDGFTLSDLVSYNHKHNLANGEGNRDGEQHNLSWNCGVDGPTEEPAVLALRERQKRNLMAALLLSVGVPMIGAGDELSRTQGGNNNAYCQDNEISWLDWELDSSKKAFLEFTCRLLEFRRRQPALTRRRFFQGRGIRGPEWRDIAWIRPDGGEMEDACWDAGFIRCLGVWLAGDGAGVDPDPNPKGEPIPGDDLLLLFNGHHEPIEFVLIPTRSGEDWRLFLDTGCPEETGFRSPGGLYRLVGRSLAVLISPVPASRAAVPQAAVRA
ncbi:MAG: glycogen debranching protein GlgX [Armatimonadetes bacterium]|nr:glycogen debranching protein GlgX [Armatimonadota bacterium]